MEIRYSRELDASYLIIAEALPRDMIFARMAEHASPAGLLRMESRETEDGMEYRYLIDGLKSMEGSLSTREIEAAEIRELMHSLYRVSNEMQEYLLKPDQLFLEPGLIYRGKEGWYFCCDPSRDEDFFGQLQALSRYILKKCNHSDEESSRIAYELFRVCHEENFTFNQIWEAVEVPDPEEIDIPVRKEKEDGFLRRLRRFMGF